MQMAPAENGKMPCVPMWRTCQSNTKLVLNRQALRDIVQHQQHFLVVGNDGNVSKLNEALQVVAQWKAHDSFVYSLSCHGDVMATASEDGTAKIWQQDKCIQTLYHPCVTVWSVTQTKHDIITAGSDGAVRIFTRDPARMTDTTEYDVCNTKSSGAIKKYSLASLAERGKVGETRVTTDNKVYQFNGTAWEHLGSHAEQAAPDYTFSIDAAEGVVPLTLTMNKGDNIEEVATRCVFV